VRSGVQELQEFRSYRREMFARWVELDAISKTPGAPARSSILQLLNS
jgi:hypothetical protein